MPTTVTRAYKQLRGKLSQQIQRGRNQRALAVKTKVFFIRTPGTSTKKLFLPYPKLPNKAVMKTAKFWLFLQQLDGHFCDGWKAVSCMLYAEEFYGTDVP